MKQEVRLFSWLKWTLTLVCLTAIVILMLELNQDLSGFTFLSPIRPKRYETFHLDSTNITNERSFVIILVPSSLFKSSARAFMRDTILEFWPKNKSFNASVVFFLGRDQNGEDESATQENMLQEALNYHDIVQTDCIESYEHLTCKMLAIMTWTTMIISTRNLKISWLIKADDDVAINTELLAEKIENLNEFDQIYCHIRWFPVPNRKVGSKWKVSFGEWPSPVYPQYCHGPSYLFGPRVAEKILKNYHSSRGGWGQFKRFEDLFLTGILGSDLGIPLQEFDPGWFSSYSSDIPAILAHKQRPVETHIWRQFWEQES